MITEENFLDFNCPYCSGTISFPESVVGSAQEWPTCLESIIVPQAGHDVGRNIPLPIVTPRLKLRRFAPNDWKALLQLASDEEGFSYVEGLPGGREEEVLRWLEEDAHIRLTTPNQILHLAMELQEGGALIGYLGLWFTDAHRLQARLNVSLHRNHQHKGFAREAVGAMLGFCFEGIRLHRVAARCDSTNTAACRLCENAGMRREGEFVKDQPLLEGGWTNSIWYAALAEEYRHDSGSMT